MSYLEQVTKKKAPQAPVVTIIGFPGVGKTTLAATFPAPIFIQAENAASVFELAHENQTPAMMPEVPTPSQKRGVKPSEVILAQLRELATVQHDFKTVVIDSVTVMNQLFEAEVVEFDANDSVNNIVEAAGGYGKGYFVVSAMHASVRNACEHLRRKGMTIVFLGHSGVAKIKNRPDVEPYSTWSLDMHEASRRVYIATSDAVLYLKSKDFVTGGDADRKGNVKKLGKMMSTGERVLITQSDGTIGFVDAKNRYRMPGEIECLEWQNPIMPYIPYYGLERPTQ